ncbi:MAG TPA: hypothetical protein DCO79_00525 [Spirochaeta sp.]|nr:hypothetical protein [Spirochaeta sp.]
MKKKISRIIACSITAALSVYLFSCRPEDEADIKTEAAGEAVSLENTADDEKINKVRDDSLFSRISEPEGRDFLLYTDDAEDVVYQQDFEIGPLQNYLGLDEQTAEILRTADDFLRSIVNMDPSYELVASDKKDFVQRNISFSLEQAVPLGYRIGLINTLAEPVRADIRLEGKESFAEGTIYFIMEGRWKVFDFQMNFKDLKKEETPVESVWYPSEKLM